jgi:uncharacterized protein (TIGR03435 family)
VPGSVFGQRGPVLTDLFWARCVFQAMNFLRLAIPGLAVVAMLSAQSGKRAEFEVASVKPSAPPQGQVNVGLHVDGAQVNFTYLSLKEYLGIAYQLKAHQIVGPEWITSERFDIAAKLPEGATRSQVPEMVQNLLADRFQVRFHREPREFPVYALVTGKAGPKLQASAAESAADKVEGKQANVNVTASGGPRGVSVNLGKGSSYTFADNKLQGVKLTMAAFADVLARFMDRPVVDLTEIKGDYDLTPEFTPEDFRAMTIRSALAAGVVLPPEVVKMSLEGSSQDSLFTGVQSLGLRLDRRKAPLEVLVVDQAEKTPAAN